MIEKRDKEITYFPFSERLCHRSRKVEMESSISVKNFHKIFNVFNIVLIIFGLSSLRPFTTNGAVEYKFSYICVVYSFGISGLIIYVFFLQVTEFQPEEDNLVLKILYWYLAVVGTIMAILMITTAIANTNNFARLINDSENFEVFTLIMSNSKILKWASVKQLCLCFSILTACYLWDFISSENGLSFATAVIILMYFLFPIYNSLCISQFYITLFWLGRLFLTINRSLIQLKKVQSETKGHLVIYSLDEDMATYPKRQEANAGKILRLRRLYHKIFKLSHNLNTIFGSRNLLLVLHHCALGTVYTYWAIRHSFPGVEIKLYALLNMYRAAIMSLVSIMWIIWPSTLTVGEVSRTKVLVQDLITVTSDKSSIDQLQIFSLQLLQEPVYFAPHGFFNLSNKALLSMLGAVTSYLVILLQYHLMYIQLQQEHNSLNTTKKA